MTQENATVGFREVDCTADPDFLVRYLEAATVQLQGWKQRSFELLAVKEGAHLLDIGCGAGDDVRALAQMVGHIGRVVGLDTSETMITTARKRAEGTGLPVEYRIGDAQQLDFPDNTFDGCRAERVFVHVENPRQALAEMVRVTKPGGKIVVIDPDFDTLMIATEDRTVTRRVVTFTADHLARNGWMGRQLWALFHEAQLTDITALTYTGVLTDYAAAMHLLRLRESAEGAQAAGVISGDEVVQWLSELEERGKVRRFFSSLTYVCLSGSKP